MYCSTCGTKLADNAQFCPNCGTKVEVQTEEVKETVAEVKEAAVEVKETVEEKKEETVQAAVEVKETVAEVKEEVQEQVTEVKEEVKDTASEIKEEAKEAVSEVKEAVEDKAAEVKETAAEVKETAEEVKEPVAEVKEEVKEAVAEVKEEVKETVAAQAAPEPAPAPAPQAAPEPAPAPQVAPAPQAAPAPAPAPQSAPEPAAAPASAKEAKPKKKGKGCLIAFIIVAAIFLVIVVLIVLAVVLFLLLGRSSGVTANDYTNSSAYYGDYVGYSKVENTYGSQQLADYLSDNGINIAVEDLYTDSSEKPFAISLYEDSDTTPAAWDMIINMGDYLGDQRFSNKTFITYADYAKGNYGGGDIIISEDNYDSFSISVSDIDQNGYLSDSLFGIKDTEGQYQIDMNGSCDGNKISGVMTISILYGDMETPYTAEITFDAQKK